MASEYEPEITSLSQLADQTDFLVILMMTMIIMMVIK